MIKLTLGQAKTPIAAVLGDSGLPISDARVIQYINNGQMELSQEGEFPGIVDQWHILSVDGNITLPTHLDRLLQLTVRGIPQTVASPWYSLVAYGPGEPDDRDGSGVWWAACDGGWMITDKGEFPTREPFPEDGLDGPWVLRVYTAVDESIITDGTGANPVCTIQGSFEDRIIRSQVDGSWINGVQVELDYNQPYVETTQEFDSILAFTKPVTNGYIRMTAWNGTTELELSDYLPTDTNPSYHRYHSRWLQQLNAAADDRRRFVRARCWKRFVPASEDTDELLIGNILALTEICIAQWKRTSDDYEGYVAHKTQAVDIMKKEAARYRGKSRIPALVFQRGYGIGSSLPAIR